MIVLGLDVGTSSVKAGIVRDGKIIGRAVSAGYPTHFDGAKVEVDPGKVLAAIGRVIGDFGKRARGVDAVGLSVMGPAWIAMDGRGKALTRIVTHQDRRSVEVARELVTRVGKERFLKVVGNLPFPGSISVSTLAWFAKYEPQIIRRADLIGHLNTFLHRQLTGERAIDPSNASFTGMYETLKLGGWSEEICAAVGVSTAKLPEILGADELAGKITREAGRRFGLPVGLPVFTGMIDTGAALMLWGPRAGQLINVSGSTDVLMLCTKNPRPHEKLLTRALGIGDYFLSVATLAAAGSSITWMRDQFFRDLAQEKFFGLVRKLARGSKHHKSAVVFEPYLAGERASIEQKYGAFSNLTLGTTREDMLVAVIDALARASAARLGLLSSGGAEMERTVFVSGGTLRVLADVLHRDWPGRWRFAAEEEASLRGLSRIRPV
jgi:xylulokinase